MNFMGLIKIRFISLVCCFVLFSTAGQAASLSYELTPRLIAKDTWLLQGKLEDFSRDNGANIVNTAFIVTSEGVVVIDTGPSKRYAQAFRRAIATVTDKPVTDVFITHHHPDHFLGNQAFADVNIWALPTTGRLIAEQGNAFAENMYRLAGDWMRGTEVLMPNKPLEQTAMSIGGHRFTFLSLVGHTGADLAILDETTGTLFAGDLVFYQRALTTPHTPGIDQWLADLDRLDAVGAKLIVPGHGPVDSDGKAILQMRAYLAWLDKTLTQAAHHGLSMNEVMKIPTEPEFADIALSQYEFIRTVFHLYAGYEEAAF
ncbi:MAG: quinoprotein relay system zinc metallohydrolase 1 [Paraglaciecola chathamensis]